jgi:hypothetical protein
VCPAIDNPANCKIQTIFPFLRVKSMGAAEIHRELSAIYEQNVISEEALRQ